MNERRNWIISSLLCKCPTKFSSIMLSNCENRRVIIRYTRRYWSMKVRRISAREKKVDWDQRSTSEHLISTKTSSTVDSRSKEDSWEKYQESHCQSCLINGISSKIKKNRKRNYKYILKRCALIRMRSQESMKNRIEYSKMNGDQFTIVWRTMMSEIKINDSGETVISEMIKQLSMEKICSITRHFHELFINKMTIQSSWQITKLMLLRKSDAESRKGIRSDRIIALSSRMSIAQTS